LLNTASRLPGVRRNTPRTASKRPGRSSDETRTPSADSISRRTSAQRTEVRLGPQRALAPSESSRYRNGKNSSAVETSTTKKPMSPSRGLWTSQTPARPARTAKARTTVFSRNLPSPALTVHSIGSGVGSDIARTIHEQPQRTPNPIVTMAVIALSRLEVSLIPSPLISVEKTGVI
jgi:hypothetical protein